MRLRRLCPLLLCLLLLTGCGQRLSPKNNPLREVSLEKGFNCFYSFDGETAAWHSLRDKDLEREILASLAAAPAALSKDWTSELVTLPIYGFEIRTEHSFFQAAWSNGYWITEEGTAYRFDFDFAALAESTPWEDEGELISSAFLPCSDTLFRQGDTWRADLLPPAEELHPAEGITFTAAGLEDMVLHTRLRNDTGEMYYYGEEFRLQVFLDGAWRDVPGFGGRLFHSIEYRLPPNALREIDWECGYGFYSENLPAGQYRIVICDDLSAEFTI